jgi:Na+/H+-dicarboxylate symporter
LAAIIQPGVGVDLTGAPASALQETIPLSERLISIVPENPFAALAEGNILAIIFFAILIGVSLLSIGEQGQSLSQTSWMPRVKWCCGLRTGSWKSHLLAYWH